MNFTDSGMSNALSESVSEKMSDASSFWLHGRANGRFRAASMEDAEALGFAEDGPLIICRESDGAFFAVQFSALAVPLSSAAEREKAAAELPAESCWVLWSACGCVRGVTVARGSKTGICAVTEAEAWLSLYDDWGRAERDRAAGFRAELMTHERYVAEVSPLMRARCPHQPAATLALPPEERAGQQRLPEAGQ